MQINVSQLLKEPIGATRDYEASEIVDVSGDGKGRMVQGEVSLLRTHRGILVKGAFDTEAELTCSRCLNSFSYTVNLNIDEEYLPTVDVVSGTLLPSPEEPTSFNVDEHHVIDLTEAIRQYTLLVIPMKPLCHENCAGLCQDCGHNLNQGLCDCSVPVADPRWSELTKLL